MKNLNKRIFFTIFSILTIFLITVLGIYNYQNYSFEESRVRNNLFMMDKNFHKPLGDNQERFDDTDRKFMDSVIYTINLDENNDITGIINHSTSSDETTKIKEKASEILKKLDDDTEYVGNLYFNKYSYAFKDKSKLIIVDNSKTNERLQNILKITLILFLVFEVVIVIISKAISRLISRPVEDTFNKQKRFIEDASHELKTPIAVIMANAEMLEKDKKEEKWLKNIVNETERMNKLVKDLLDLAKLENGVNKDSYTISNISKEIEKTVLTFESIAFENNVNLDYKIEEDIKLNCNVDQIKQLVAILLDNAIKHSYKDKCVKVSLYKQKEGIVLNVTNKGDTISKDNLEKIFERFYRVDSSRNRNQNRYGLGLAIAKNIVENHNGKITVESSNNKTTFQVVFK